jgi:hypothetical protein
MRAAHPRRSMFVTIFALMSFALSGMAIFAFVVAKAWDPHSYYWHSDVTWSVVYVPPSPSLEQQRINRARDKALSLYEGPMTAAFAAIAVATFVASLGLLFRKNWARLLIITVLAISILEVAWITWLFWSLRRFGASGYIEGFATIVVLGLIAWKFQSPSTVSEFRNAPAQSVG